MNDKKMPIGFYIKQIDKLLTEKINLIQAEYGLTRTSWQILNTINEQGNSDREELIKLISQLADRKTINDTLTKFQSENLICVENENRLSLTKKGKILFDDCSKKQNEFRKISMKSITEPEYQTTILTLEQIIKNIQ